MTTRTPVARLISCAALAGVYYVAGRIGLSLAVLNASTSPVWPPTGIAIAALLILGRDVWPGITVGAFLVNLSTSGSVLVSAVISGGNSCEALLGWFLISRFANGVRAFERTTDVFRFVVFSAVVAPIVSATPGVIALLLAGITTTHEWVRLWWTWWLGDAAGALIVAPALILAWTDRRPRARWAPIRAILQVVVLGTVAALVFGGWDPFGLGNYPIGVFFIPLLLWPAFQLGQRETAIGVVLLSAIAVWGTAHDRGPYARLSRNEALLVVQIFTAVVAATTASVAAVVAERKRLQDQLERRVSERTEQLKSMNATLRAEIAERERMQTALRAGEARLLEAQAVAHVGSWEWDVASNTVWWSEELYRIHGVDRAAFSASYEGFLALVHPEDRAAVEAAVGRALAEGKAYAIEHRIVRPDGVQRTLAARGRVIHDAAGRPVRMLGIGQDVTERRIAEEQQRQLFDAQIARRQAEEASRMKDEFLATISHELRTPLNAVLGWAQLLSAGTLDERGAAKALRIIERNAGVQARLIDDLLDLSKFAGGQVAIDPRLMEVVPLVKTALDAIEPAAAARQVALELSVSAPGAQVFADPERLLQVVSNLLSNAVKFTTDGGRIQVTVDSDDTQVHIRVTDSGTGIDPGHLHHVFEPFWQADTTLTRSHSGMGLGLAIVRYLVEAHGGTVRAESAGVGQGASFIVSLPAPLSASPTLLPPASHATPQPARVNP